MFDLSSDSLPRGTEGSNPSSSSAESAANFVFREGSVERSARDDPDGEYLKRNRWFESGSLQRRVRCEPVSRGNSPSYVEKPRFPRVCGPGRAARSAETRGARQHRAYGR